MRDKQGVFNYPVLGFIFVFMGLLIISGIAIDQLNLYLASSTLQKATNLGVQKCLSLQTTYLANIQNHQGNFALPKNCETYPDCLPPLMPECRNEPDCWLIRSVGHMFKGAQYAKPEDVTSIPTNIAGKGSYIVLRDTHCVWQAPGTGNCCVKEDTEEATACAVAQISIQYPAPLWDFGKRYFGFKERTLTERAAAISYPTTHGYKNIISDKLDQSYCRANPGSIGSELPENFPAPEYPSGTESPPNNSPPAYEDPPPTTEEPPIPPESPPDGCIYSISSGRFNRSMIDLPRDVLLNIANRNGIKNCQPIEGGRVNTLWDKALLPGQQGGVSTHHMHNMVVEDNIDLGVSEALMSEMGSFAACECEHPNGEKTPPMPYMANPGIPEVMHYCDPVLAGYWLMYQEAHSRIAGIDKSQVTLLTSMVNSHGVSSYQYRDETTGKYSEVFRGGVFFDRDGNPISQIEADDMRNNQGAQLCGMTASPISLVWDDGQPMTMSASQFPLKPDQKHNTWSQWFASSSYPLLVYDPSKQGLITSSTQLFGNYTFGKYWGNGYIALKSLDHNNDNILSEKELNSLSLWFDHNQNGISELGEVEDITKLQVIEIYLQPDHIDAFSGDITATIGFKRKIGNSQAIIGKSIDWYGAGGFSTKKEALKTRIPLQAFGN